MAELAIDRWENRRKMAWLATASALSFPFIGPFLMDATMMAVIAPPLYVFNGAVVGAYIGFATADDKWQKET